MENKQTKTEAEISHYGAGQLKTLDEFTSLCEAEYQSKYNLMVDDFKERKQALALKRDQKIKEFRLMNAIVSANTMQQEGQIHPSAILSVEKSIAALDLDSVGASFSIEFWGLQYGEDMVASMLCEIVSYFLNQFQVKEVAKDVQIMHLVLKLMKAQPKLRIAELIYVLNQGLNSAYGPTYQRIGIDTILGWLMKFYDDSSKHLEAKHLSGKPEAANYATPWEVVERRLKQYEDEQRGKKAVTEKVWGLAKEQREREEARQAKQPEIERLQKEAKQHYKNKK